MMPKQPLVTRRNVIAGVVCALLPLNAAAIQHSATPSATPATFAWPLPIELGDGLHILDWRFSLKSENRTFLAEIHNANEATVVTPAIGVVVPAVSGSSNYAWGNPFDPVVHAGQSTFVIGQLPNSLADADWTTAEWMLCAPPASDTKFLEPFTEIEYQVSSESIVHRPDWMECKTTLTNVGSTQIRNMRVSGIVRDAQGRICGGTAFSAIETLAPDATMEMTTNVQPSIDMTPNPLRFTDDLTGATANFSVQPRGEAVNSGCPAVMPWNR